MFNVRTERMNSFAIPVSGTPVLTTTKPEKQRKGEELAITPRYKVKQPFNQFLGGIVFEEGTSNALHPICAGTLRVRLRVAAKRALHTHTRTEPPSGPARAKAKAHRSCPKLANGPRRRHGSKIARCMDTTGSVTPQAHTAFNDGSPRTKTTWLF